MKKEKKRGSTVLTVLAITMVLILLGGILLNVIMSTTKGNESRNRRQDLKYGAEGGLEVARSYLDKNGYTELNDAAIEAEINKNAEILTEARVPESNVTKIEIKLNPLKENQKDPESSEKSGDQDSKLIGVEIVSKAKYDKNGENNEEELKMKYKIVGGHDGNFLDHGLVAGVEGVHINHNGALDLGTTSVSTGGEYNHPNESVDTVIGDRYQNQIKDLQILSPSKKAENGVILGTKNEAGGEFGWFKFYEMGKDGEMKNAMEIGEIDIEMDMKKTEGQRISIIKSNISGISIGTEGNIYEEITKIKDISILKLKISGVGDQNNRSAKIYIINSDRLLFKLNQSLSINDSVIIVNGLIESEAKSVGQIAMNNSTIIGNKINFDTNTSVNITGQPNYKEVNKTGIFTREQEEELNKLLKCIIPQWDSTNTGGKDENLVLEGGSYE